MNTPTEPLPPSAFHDFSPIEQVAQLDMVGSLVTTFLSGGSATQEQMMAAIVILRTVRDDLAYRHGLGAESQYKTAAYQAEVEIRRMWQDGTFDSPKNGA